jgi:hypothetical protein
VLLVFVVGGFVVLFVSHDRRTRPFLGPPLDRLYVAGDLTTLLIFKRDLRRRTPSRRPRSSTLRATCRTASRAAVLRCARRRSRLPARRPYDMLVPTLYTSSIGSALCSCSTVRHRDRVPDPHELRDRGFSIGMFFSIVSPFSGLGILEMAAVFSASSPARACRGRRPDLPRHLSCASLTASALRARPSAGNELMRGVN